MIFQSHLRMRDFNAVGQISQTINALSSVFSKHGFEMEICEAYNNHRFDKFIQRDCQLARPRLKERVWRGSRNLITIRSMDDSTTLGHIKRLQISGRDRTSNIPGHFFIFDIKDARVLVKSSLGG